jgi:hypothetical protein
MFWLGANIWLTTQLVFLAFQLSFLIFFIALQTRLGIPHSSITSILQCVCTHPIDSISIHFHFLCCTQGNKCIGTHDVVHNTFVAISQDVVFHVGWKHALLATMFKFFRWWVNIVLIKDDICTLANVVIANPMRQDLFPWYWTTQSLLPLMALKLKKEVIVIDTPLINSSL